MNAMTFDEVPCWFGISVRRLFPFHSNSFGSFDCCPAARSRLAAHLSA
jgi:hypothetical protein